MHRRKKCLFDPVHTLFLSALETVSRTDDYHKPLGVRRIQKKNPKIKMALFICY